MASAEEKRFKAYQAIFERIGFTLEKRIGRFIVLDESGTNVVGNFTTEDELRGYIHNELTFYTRMGVPGAPNAILLDDGSSTSIWDEDKQQFLPIWPSIPKWWLTDPGKENDDPDAFNSWFANFIPSSVEVKNSQKISGSWWQVNTANITNEEEESIRQGQLQEQERIQQEQGRQGDILNSRMQEAKAIRQNPDTGAWEQFDPQAKAFTALPRWWDAGRLGPMPVTVDQFGNVVRDEKAGRQQAEEARLQTRLEADLAKEAVGRPEGQIFDTFAEAQANAPSGFQPVQLNDGRWVFQRKAEVSAEGQIFNTFEEAQANTPLGFQPVQLTDGRWVFERAPEQEGLQDRFLGFVDESGWRIAQFGTIDPQTGEKTITSLQPLQPIEEPILSLDQMISQALTQADDLSDVSDPNVQRAQALFNFKTQPTSEERLQLALQIAQSPSDYLTLTALYTGELERESPARFGEKVAPLMPFLQQLAQQFFLDVPGITRPETVKPEVAISPAAQRRQDYLRRVNPALAARFTPSTYTPPKAEGTQEEFDQGLAESVAEIPGVNVPRVAVEERAGRLVPVILPPEGLPEAEEPRTQVLTPMDVGEEVPFGSVSPSKATGQLGGKVTIPVSQGDGQGVQIPTKVLSNFEGKVPLGTEQVPSTSISGTKPKGSLAPSVVLPPMDIEGGEVSPDSDVVKIATEAFKALSKTRRKTLPTFQQGGVVPGPTGLPRLISAEGGEMVLPNDPEERRRLLERSGILGDVFRPPARKIGEFLSQPATTQIPSLIGGGFRFRSAQTQRRMLPTQRRLFEAGIESFGIPVEDFLQQEQMATAIGTPRLASLKFRPTLRRM